MITCHLQLPVVTKPKPQQICFHHFLRGPVFQCTTMPFCFEDANKVQVLQGTAARKIFPDLLHSLQYCFINVKKIGRSRKPPNQQLLKICTARITFCRLISLSFQHTNLKNYFNLDKNDDLNHTYLILIKSLSYAALKKITKLNILNTSHYPAATKEVLI